MRLAIVGTRTFTNYKFLRKKILKKFYLSDITEIVSGGAEGVDTLAEQFAEEYNIPLKVYKPDWKKYGKKAGAIRNKKIVNRCNKIIAFWDGKSVGTKITIDMAIEAKKDLKIVITTK